MLEWTRPMKPQPMIATFSGSTMIARDTILDEFRDSYSPMFAGRK